MHRIPRFLARLVAAVLLLQVVLAPAHCLAMAAAPAGLAAVICAPDGLRTIHLGPDGQEMPAHEATEGFCPACHGVPQAALAGPPAPSAPVLAWMPAAWTAIPEGSPPPPVRAPPFAPRAPPTFG